MKNPSPICAAGWISIPVIDRASAAIASGRNGTPRRYSAWATRWASSACTPGQVARISQANRRRGPPDRGSARPRRRAGSRPRCGRSTAARAWSKPSRHAAPLRREERRRHVALARVGEDRHDPRAAQLGAAAELERGPHGGAAGDPREHPSLRARARAVSIASSSSTAMTSSITSRLSTSGTKPAPIPWILCGPGRPARQHGRGARLDRDDPAARVALLEELADAGDRAAGADARDERVDAAVESLPRSPGRWCGDGSPGWPGLRTGREGTRRRRWRAPVRRRRPRSCRPATR